MSAAHGGHWFKVEGLLQAPHQREQVMEAVADLIGHDKDPTAGRIVAALSFSFWTAMVSPSYEDLWRATLNAIATRSDGRRLSRKQLSRPLTPIRVLRNRIAHHEPILHWSLPKHHSQIVEVTTWLSPGVARWLAEIDRFPAIYPAAGYRLAAPLSSGNEE